MSAESSFPTILVIFGATGDLMGKKIAPAFFDLFEQKQLPKLFNVIGVSRRNFSRTDFQKHVQEIVMKYKGIPSSNTTLQSFLKHVDFVQGMFDDARMYAILSQKMGRVDGEWKTCANKLFYIATPPEHYKTIFTNLASAKLTLPCGPDEGWTRVLVEKPFGKDLATARALDTLLAKLFKEIQIYRIDHYLAKEMLQEILSFRFSNNLFEHNWNSQSIETIHIRLWETIGVEERGAFYDGVGALRDVGQNHLLQMLALVTMDEPASFTAAAIRHRRGELLGFLPTLTAAAIKNHTLRAQYQGYHTIMNVLPGSTTETYFKIESELDAPRWKGTTIVFESGKRLAKQRKDITVTFRHPSPCLCPRGAEHTQNTVRFSLEPTEGITIKFWAKKPGVAYAIEERSLNFMLRPKGEHRQYIEEYTKLLLDCIHGDQTSFVSTNEIKAMWKFVDPIAMGWKKNLTPLKVYEPDTLSITTESLTNSKKSHLELPRVLAMVGLGKMGSNLARRLLERGWQVVGYNHSPEPTKLLAKEGIVPAYALKECVSKLPSSKIVWLTVPAGPPVDEVLFGTNGLATLLKKGDIIIDGGNSFYKDTVRRFKKLKPLGIHFTDVGTSGGPKGARTGASLMVGGEIKVFKMLAPLFKDLACDEGYQFFAGSGAGHFVKMVHNGIEYGMMEALAEGFTILKESHFSLDLTRVASIYNHGSVIQSRLVGWLKHALEVNGSNLAKVSGRVGQLGEAAWTVQAAKELGVKSRVIAAAVKFRLDSQTHPTYTGKILTALREEFGGKRNAKLERLLSFRAKRSEVEKSRSTNGEIPPLAASLGRNDNRRTRKSKKI